MSERIEKIMKEYPQMIKEKTCLEKQINGFKGISETDMIDSMNFHQPEGDRVQTSGNSEKTARIAVNFRKQMERVNEDWIKHLENKYYLICEDIIFFESAIGSLSGNLPEVISDMVISELTWDDIAYKYHVSRTMLAKYRKKAIKELEVLYSNHDSEVKEFLLY
jgi:hypothetical protein